MSAWSRWQAVEQKIAEGHVVIIDGGMGTEVEKIAGSEALNPCGWTSSMNLTHPHAVKEAHRRYLDAGADIIIANTYATNRHILAAAGLDHTTEENNTIAVRMAKEAVAEWRAEGGFGDPLIAGSISIHGPGDEKQKLHGCCWPAPEVEVANYAEQARILIDSGVDLIFIEMLWNMEHGRRIVEGIKDVVDVPIFIGFTIFNDALHIESHDTRDGPLKIGKIEERTAKAHSHDSLHVTEAMAELLQTDSIVGINIMHTKSDLILPFVQAFRAFGWKGALGAYPDTGLWLRDSWVSAGLSPDELVKYATEWRKEGAQLFGGCCGVGPDHIQALSRWSQGHWIPTCDTCRQDFARERKTLLGSVRKFSCEKLGRSC